MAFMILVLAFTMVYSICTSLTLYCSAKHVLLKYQILFFQAILLLILLLQGKVLQVKACCLLSRSLLPTTFKIGRLIALLFGLS